MPREPSIDSGPELALRNPHAVLAALQRRPDDVLEVRLPERGAGEAWSRVAELAESHARPVRRAGGPRDGRSARGKGARKTGREGGAEADVLPREDLPLELLFADAKTREGGRGLWLAIDRVQDPHNMGALFRAASFFGVQGVLLTTDQTAPLTAVAYDVSAGGVETVPFSFAGNFARDLREARDAGLWILGSAEEATLSVEDVDRERPWMLVLGNEEKGMRRLTRELCDDICAVPALGEVGSLNVAMAGAVIMSSLRRGVSPTRGSSA